MAGWDSDAIVERMEEAVEKQQEAVEARSRWRSSSAEELERDRRLESLRLSRARVEEQLSRATSPAHRTMLGKALEAIKRQEAEQPGEAEQGADNSAA